MNLGMPVFRRLLGTTEGDIMSDPQPGMSNAFHAFMEEASGHAQAWMAMVQSLDSASALDKKTEELAYLAVLAALRLESGVPLHVRLAKQAGASREEVISAILVGLPAAGQSVTQVLPVAIAIYDAE
jgi:alkylhydroperoxidase/carboxymuconolactone decarboxylase family protein YurZ